MLDHSTLGKNYLIEESRLCYEKNKIGGVAQSIKFPNEAAYLVSYLVATNGSFIIRFRDDKVSVAIESNISQNILSRFQQAQEEGKLVGACKVEDFSGFLSRKQIDGIDYIKIRGSYYNINWFYSAIKSLPGAKIYVYKDRYSISDTQYLYISSRLGEAILLPMRISEDVESETIDTLSSNIEIVKFKRITLRQGDNSSNRKTDKKRKTAGIAACIFWCTELFYLLVVAFIFVGIYYWNDVYPIVRIPLLLCVFLQVVSYVAYLINKCYLKEMRQPGSIGMALMGFFVVIHVVHLFDVLQSQSIDSTLEILKIWGVLVVIALILGIIVLYYAAPKKRLSVDKNGNIICPKCGSYHIVTMTRGWHPFWGFIGSSEPMNVCQACGYKFEPGE